MGRPSATSFFCKTCNGPTCHKGEKTKRAWKADLRNRLRRKEKVQKIRHEFTRERERERERERNKDQKLLRRRGARQAIYRAGGAPPGLGHGLDWYRRPV